MSLDFSGPISSSVIENFVLNYSDLLCSTKHRNILERMIFFNGSVVMRILSEEAVDGVIMKYVRIFCFFLFWLLHHSLWFDSGLILTFLVWRGADFNRPYNNPSTDYTSLNFWSLFQTELSSSPSSLLKTSNLCEKQVNSQFLAS